VRRCSGCRPNRLQRPGASPAAAGADASAPASVAGCADAPAAVGSDRRRRRPPRLGQVQATGADGAEPAAPRGAPPPAESARGPCCSRFWPRRPPARPGGGRGPPGEPPGSWATWDARWMRFAAWPRRGAVGQLGLEELGLEEPERRELGCSWLPASLVGCAWVVSMPMLQAEISLQFVPPSPSRPTRGDRDPRVHSGVPVPAGLSPGLSSRACPSGFSPEVPHAQATHPAHDRPQ
jgi:hypothetical protein